MSQELFKMHSDLDNAKELIFDCFKFMIVLVQGVVLYFQANRVITESEDLGGQIYKCNWIEQPATITRSLLIAMIRTTRILKMECYGIVILSNMLTLKVLQAIYTYLIFSFAKK
uniref:Uncharacterized protein LOC114330208 isoform X2 n=1 Tax=Diabrotica virgifera virgifera TaxID=50390 RepID=A0A6P7FR07_DIAVI